MLNIDSPLLSILIIFPTLLPWDPTSLCIMSILAIMNTVNIRSLTMIMYNPPTFEIIPSTSSRATISFRRITWLFLPFLSKARSLSNGMNYLHSEIFLTFCNFLHQRVKMKGLQLAISSKQFKIVRICGEEDLNEGCEWNVYLQIVGINVVHDWFNVKC